jgi:hypothetical protein
MTLGMYFLAVIPQKMESAGYQKDITFTVTVRLLISFTPSLSHRFSLSPLSLSSLLSPLSLSLSL